MTITAPTWFVVLLAVVFVASRVLSAVLTIHQYRAAKARRRHPGWNWTGTSTAASGRREA